MQGQAGAQAVMLNVTAKHELPVQTLSWEAAGSRQSSGQSRGVVTEIGAGRVSFCIMPWLYSS